MQRDIFMRDFASSCGEKIKVLSQWYSLIMFANLVNYETGKVLLTINLKLIL
jgi:hypothetical protein